MLYLVSTPIGNLKDITFRAIEILKQVDEIICESTDKANILLKTYQIKKPLIHLTDENQLQVAAKIIEKLKSGKKLALISDAGTPTLSDPGQFLVKQAIKENINIIPIPGPSAVLSALITSGLSTSPFLFLGFLPKNKSQKQKLFQELINLKIHKKNPSIIFFESPQRINETLEILNEINSEIKISLAREMTKIYEEFLRGNIKNVLTNLKQKKEIKGEITVVFSL
ncbi:MAG: ribosomal RNA small subunit methyltransferase I [Patescibacteria group bacterium]|nr:MAG: ribosomal RNA small subunit methyltransferase I [Patescibacteria group bacterium]